MNFTQYFPAGFYDEHLSVEVEQGIQALVAVALDHFLMLSLTDNPLQGEENGRILVRNNFGKALLFYGGLVANLPYNMRLSYVSLRN